MLKSLIIIGIITLLVAFGSFFFKPKDISWVVKLQRPKWLFFEPLIPVIWTVVFTGGAISAALVWEREPGSLKTWLLMGVYLILEIITVAYIPATLRFRSLKIGTALGGIGVILGIFLTFVVASISGLAALCLIPYLLWSPIGTLTTWEMIQLNPDAV